MYFDEFEAVCEAWSTLAERQNREAWERTRMLAAICIQPHVRRRVTPRKLLPLPWDNEKTRTQEAPELTPEERRQRFTSIVSQMDSGEPPANTNPC
ncbi:MAG: hypothetical protein NC043_07085 [Muribaculaceae bacterium]|nr:hypothetical protein [Muribaculaceae bacterium]